MALFCFFFAVCTVGAASGAAKGKGRYWGCLDLAYLMRPPKFLCKIWKKRNERPNVGGVSIRLSNRSRNGAPSRKGSVVNGRMTKASNK